MVENDSLYDDMGMATGDIDNDGDMDICIASGGYEYKENSAMHHDRIYINDGKGGFSHRLLFTDSTASSDIVLFDYDEDQDLDVLSSGYVKPQSYPLGARTFLWEDKGHDLFSK